ncbi:MAG: hypothetical protein ACRDIF_01550 [Actinomycetota bacterium]
MPLFEIGGSQQLVPFRQLRGGSDLYEKEIERLLWNNLEEFTGEGLFRIARQPTIGGGGRPDVVALDRAARVIVIEVKRDVDRGQLAQCLEYAGWARTASLDQLSALYHGGPEAFFRDWQDFMETLAPARVRPSPRLMLVARDFQGRTASALNFLVENGLPVQLIRVAVYEDAQGRRFVDVEGEHEPVLPGVAPVDVEEGTRLGTTIDGRAVRVSDLLEARLLTPGEPLVWNRPRLGRVYRASVEETGDIRLENGEAYSSPSRAAMVAAQIPSCDGWWAWRQDKAAGLLLKDLRTELVARAQDRPAPIDGSETS